MTKMRRPVQINQLGRRVKDVATEDGERTLAVRMQDAIARRVTACGLQVHPLFKLKIVPNQDCLTSIDHRQNTVSERAVVRYKKSLT